MSLLNGNQELSEEVADVKIVDEDETQKTDPEESSKELTELDKILLVEAPAGPIDPLSMDDTSHIEISQMANDKYSSEIIEEMNENIDLDYLNKLAKQDKKAFLEEVPPAINKTWRSIQHLETHTDMFVVRISCVLGMLLNDAEDCFKKKSAYMKWLRSNFGYHKLRYFQQAKELAKMGKLSLWYASLGKNRLLEFNRLRKISDKTLAEILRSHPFRDTSDDIGGNLFREHIDAIITFYRFQKGEISYCTFEHADIIASYLHGSITVATVKKLKEWLNETGNQECWFEFIVMNKLEIPRLDSQREIRTSVNKALVGVSNLQKEIQTMDTASFSIDEQILKDAHETILALAEKFGVTLTMDHAATIKNQEGE